MSCTHNHDCSDHDCAAGYSLYKHIDLPKVWALNAAVEGSAKSIFKSWERRLETTGESLTTNDEDSELLLFVPFTNDVVIKGISIIGGPDGTTPAKMRAFTNRIDIDFSNVQDVSPVQEWDLVENPRGELEYQTRYTRFQGVASLLLHFPRSLNGTKTEILYIGLRGEATGTKRDAVTTIVYEAVANPSEHRTPAEDAPPEIKQTF
jgi:hypothetical protein